MSSVANDTSSIEDFRTFIDSQRETIQTRLAKAVAFRSIHDIDFEQCRASALWTQQEFASENIANTRVVEGIDHSFAVFGHTPAQNGFPTVLLYCHHDVQPADEQPGWNTNPWQLVVKGDGRWYGRGSADCKGNLVMHLAALRALHQFTHSDKHPFGGVGIRLVVEGSEEAGGEGLETLVSEHPEWFDADAILIADTGNVAVGAPTLTASLRGVAQILVEVDTLKTGIHSGMYGGPAPDALAALIHTLSSLRDASGATTIDGLANTQTWEDADDDSEQFRKDAGVLDGVDLSSAGTVAELAWARPAVTVTALDAPRVSEAINAISPSASAALNLRVPPGMDPEYACGKLIAHLKSHVPWNARISFHTEGLGDPFLSDTTGSAYRNMSQALADAYGREVILKGEGGSIPLCPTLQKAVPKAQLVLFGVEEPQAQIHGPNESVDPEEIVALALAESLFLSRLKM